MTKFTYSDFVQRVRRFKRSSLLQITSHMSWTVWGNARIHAEGSEAWKEFYLVRAHAGRIAAISAATGGEFRDEIAKITDVQKLCHDYLAIEEPLIDAEEFEKTDIAPLKDCLEKSIYFKDVPSDLPLIRLCAGMLTPIRIIQLQHESWDFGDPYHNVVRNYAILNEFLGLLSEAIKNKYLKRLGVEPKHLFMLGLLLLAGAQIKKGLLVIEESYVNEEIRAKTGLDSGAVKLMAVRFSRDFQGFRDWHDAHALKLNPFLAKYATNPLIETPLIQIPPNKFAVPSPWCLLKKIKYACWEPILGQGDKREIDLIGEALKKYFATALPLLCPGATIFDLDNLKCLKNKKHADFLVVKNGVGLLIELKKSMGEYESIAVSEPVDVVNSWERIASAAIQCGNTVVLREEIEKELKIRLEKISAVVCCLGDVVSSGAFLVFCDNSGLIKKWGLQNLEVVSVDVLECWLMDVGVEIVASAVSEKWERRQIQIDAPSSEIFNKERDPKKTFELHWNHLSKFDVELSAAKRITPVDPAQPTVGDSPNLHN